MTTLIDWQSSESHLFLNPRLPEREREWIKGRRLPEMPGHIWVGTSGTSSKDEVKLVALSKAAFLASAAAVNTHLRVRKKDVWLNVLPLFHVGGLSILARAHVSGCRMVIPENWTWSPRDLMLWLEREPVTLLSLVPTQVYDLIAQQLEPPPGLRAVLVGGGALRLGVYRLGRKLGWPLLPSYGLTECCSQVATASLATLSEASEEVPAGEVLSHVQVKLDASGCIGIKGPSLLSGWVRAKAGTFDFSDPRDPDGWYWTEDVGAFEGPLLRVLGRKDAVVKVAGELVNLNRLNFILEGLAEEFGVFGKVALVPRHDERLDHSIVLAHEATIGPSVIDKLVEAYNGQVLPFERVRERSAVNDWPTTELGKIRLRTLIETIR